MSNLLLLFLHFSSLCNATLSRCKVLLSSNLNFLICIKFSCACPHCRYTSIGSIYDTVPNALLSDSSTGKSFRPAYMLSDGRLERAGRAKKTSNKTETNSVASNGMNNAEGEQMISRSASVIVVGDEIL